jgi:hypothetical protein
MPRPFPCIPRDFYCPIFTNDNPNLDIDWDFRALRFSHGYVLVVLVIKHMLRTNFNLSTNKQASTSERVGVTSIL